MRKIKKERRRTSRVRYSNGIILSFGRKKIKGEVKDISLKGIYVAVPPQNDLSFLDKNDKITQCGGKAVFKISLRGRSPCLTFGGIAQVVRVKKGGLGLYIRGMNLSSLMHLRALLENNSGDAQRIRRDLKRLLSPS